MRSSSRVTDSRIEHRVENVGEKIEQDDEGGVENDHAEHERVIAIDRAFDEVTPDAGNAENALDDERASEQPREGGTEIADERQQRHGQGVPQHDQAV